MGTRNQYIWLVAALLFTDLAILVDIPVLRPLLGFLFFTTIPGLLVLYILRVSGISLLKKFLLSVGLSVTFLIFAALLVNALLPLFGFSRPLSTYSLLLSFNVILFTLGFIAYWRNRKYFDSSPVFNFRIDKRDTIISPLLLSLIFPILSVLGTRLMNETGNNIVLLAMFSLIPVYIILLMWQNRRLTESTYPVAILMMSLALLLSRGLTSDYLIGGDIYSEYYSFQITSRLLHWSMGNLPGMVGGSLSITLLPTVFHSILDIDPLYIYKAVFPIIISLVPVVTYAVCVKYLERLYAFLAACFFIVQLPFIYLLTGQMRVAVALFFFSLAMMVLLDDKMGGRRRTVIFTLFGASTLVAYYATPVLLFALVFIVWLVSVIPGSPSKSLGVVKISTVLVILALVVLWWGVAVQINAPGEDFDLPGEIIASIEKPNLGVTPTPVETPDTGKRKASAAAGYWASLRDMFADFGLSDLSDPELRGPEVQALLGISGASVPRKISLVVNYASFLIVGFGILAGWLYKKWRNKYAPNFLVLMSASLIIAALPIILPRLSINYAGDRIYLQLLLFLAPAFILGCLSMPRFISQRRILPVIGLVLVGLFLSNSYLLHLFMDSPQGDILNTESSDRAQVYVYNSEVMAADWLGDHNVDNAPVYIGSLNQYGGGIFEFTDYGVSRKFEIQSFSSNALRSGSEGWVLLRHINVVDGIGYALDESNFSQLFSMSEYLEDNPPVLGSRNRIYTTGDAEIYW